MSIFCRILRLTGITALGLGALSGLLPAQTNVSLGFNNSGPASLLVNGTQFLAYGDFRLNGLTFLTPAGQSIAGDLTGSVTADPSRQLVTRTASWGTIGVQYGVTGNQLNVGITVNNQSSNTIQGLWMEPLGIQFPSTPLEFQYPLVVNSIGQPAIQQTTYNGGVMVLAANDILKPVQLGFPWSYNAPANTIFPLQLNTGTVSMYPNQYQAINRPIPPGGSDYFAFSLRFGPAGATEETLAPDIYQAFAAAFPATLKWSDRRPIGALFLATAGTGWPTNPRGWLIDPTIDVFTADGVANLKTRILAYANNSVSILQSMNAQGMITWDIEGQQFPDPTSYVGDPSQFLTTAPEMADIADAYFQVFRNAGLRVGVCIRPQQFVLSPDGSSAQQVFVTDPAQITTLLMNKVAYAVNRWGASLFYVDSNVNLTDPNPIPASIFQALTAAFPNVLFLPEHSNMQYFAYTAPYKQLNQGNTSTPPDVRSAYPNSFTVIYTADGPITQDSNALVNAVSQGDTLLFRGWFADPQNAQDLSIYQQAATLAPSHKPPSVSITSPANGTSVGGAITLSATAAPSGTATIVSVQFQIDAAPVATVTAAPWSAPLNTASLSNGSHTVTAIATDNFGSTATASVTITISNAVPAPVVTITSPANGAIVSNTVALSAAVTAGGTTAITGVQYSVDGSPAGSAATAPWSVSLNTDGMTNGSHTIAAIATDNLGDTGRASVNVTVSNASSPPVVNITSPAANGTVTGVVNFSATAAASSATTIRSVSFLIDGNTIATAASAPYSTSLNTANFSNGTHTLTATALDALGNSGNASIGITVNNPIAVSGGGFTYKRSITISAAQIPNTDQTNFPVLIEGVYPFLAATANGGHVQNPHGYDIAFTSDSAGIQPLNWEMESYNPANGSVAFWVQVPLVSHTANTVFYLWYGNSAISTFLGSSSKTWDGNYVAVYHMADQTGAMAVADSTANRNTGAATAATSTRTVTGAIGSALQFNGSSDAVTAGNGTPFAITGPLTIEAWVNAASVPNSPWQTYYIAGKGYDGTNEAYFLRLEADGNGTPYAEAGTFTFPTAYEARAEVSSFSGGWHHLAGTYDGTWNIYVDGVKTGSSQTQPPFASPPEPFVIGARDSTGALRSNFPGIIDEVRISNVARTADWISAEYLNQSQPGAFYIMGAESGPANQ